MSLAITDRHIRSCRALDLRETLFQDYRLAWRCLEGHDFLEGVRAALIDKDHAPRWVPAEIDAIEETEVARYFEPLGADDLALPTREQMQAARV
jgi:enoyl-CoA hydratase